MYTAKEIAEANKELNASIAKLKKTPGKKAAEDLAGAQSMKTIFAEIVKNQKKKAKPKSKSKK